jgi:flagellin
MALAIATNNAALNAAASASSVNRDMETSMARLSTGKRINSASDDAAGVAISSRLSAEIRGTDQAIRNSMDGQALIDTAEGAHKEIENILQRMREVAVQAANDTNNAQDRGNLQAEMDAMSTEIDRIAGTTTWAGANLMEDSVTDFSFQVGAATGTKNQISVDIKSMNTVGLGLDGGANGVTAAAAVEAKAAQASYTPTAANLSGATITGDVLASTGTAGTGVDTDITLTDAAGNTTTVTLLGSNTDTENAALLNAVDGIAATANDDANDATDGQGIDLTYASTTAQAAVTPAAAVSALDAGNNISVEDTSTDAGDADDNARASIEDADFALETTNLAKNQILQQASTAMLAQANASKQNVLSLLQG